MPRPKRHDRFEHARWITGSPKAGTARPIVCEVTAVRLGVVYYRGIGDSGRWRIDVTKLDSIVGRWLDAAEPKEADLT